MRGSGGVDSGHLVSSAAVALVPGVVGARVSVVTDPGPVREDIALEVRVVVRLALAWGHNHACVCMRYLACCGLCAATCCTEVMRGKLHTGSAIVESDVHVTVPSSCTPLKNCGEKA